MFLVVGFDHLDQHFGHFDHSDSYFDPYFGHSESDFDDNGYTVCCNCHNIGPEGRERGPYVVW